MFISSALDMFYCMFKTFQWSRDILRRCAVMVVFWSTCSVSDGELVLLDLDQCCNVFSNSMCLVFVYRSERLIETPRKCSVQSRFHQSFIMPMQALAPKCSMLSLLRLLHSPILQAPSNASNNETAKVVVAAGHRLVHALAVNS